MTGTGPPRREGFEGVREYPQGARTAADAAAAIGCDVAQIVKSLVFRDAAGAPVLVLCSGSNTVDEAALGVSRADAAFVREVTGMAIGGVAPYGHPAPLRTLVDEDLLTHEQVWAAAGTPRHVFPLTPRQLVERSGGTVRRVSPAG
jgi:prolyl-tRNA editing enzyme YbaK/EbsC (Cys-tRNA(Pro) deacylase)